MSSHAPRLDLYLLGPPEVHLGEKLLTFPTRKTLALLIYLALEGGSQPREYLATLLWPESNPERSHASLRNTLGHLQTALLPGQAADLTLVWAWAGEPYGMLRMGVYQFAIQLAQ